MPRLTLFRNRFQSKLWPQKSVTYWTANARLIAYWALGVGYRALGRCQLPGDFSHGSVEFLVELFVLLIRKRFKIHKFAVLHHGQELKYHFLSQLIEPGGSLIAVRYPADGRHFFFKRLIRAIGAFAKGLKNQYKYGLDPVGFNQGRGMKKGKLFFHRNGSLLKVDNSFKPVERISFVIRRPPFFFLPDMGPQNLIQI